MNRFRPYLPQFTLFLFLVLSVQSCMLSKKSALKKGELSEDQQINFKYTFSEANRYKMLNDSKHAIESFTDCIQINPHSAASHYELARHLSQNKELASAIKHTQTAINLQTQNKWYRMYLIDLYMASDDYKKCIRELKDLVKTFPEEDEYPYKLAELYAYTSDYKSAIEVYNRIEKQFGFDDKIYIERVRLYTKLDKKQEAIKDLKILIEKIPTELNYYSMLVALYIDLKEYDKATVELHKMVELDPNNGAIHLQLAAYYNGKKQFDKMFEELKKVFEDKNFEVDKKLTILAEYRKTLSNTEESQKQWNELIDILMRVNPENADVHNQKAYCLLSEGQSKKALEEFKIVAEKDKKKYANWEQLLILSYQLAEFDTMLSKSQEALSYFPNQSKLYLFQGIALMKKGKNAEASQVFKNGLDYVIDDKDQQTQFYEMLAESYYKNNQFTESFAAYEKAIATSPNNVMILNNYSYYLALQKENLSRAKTLIQKCIELAPKNYNYLDTYAWVLYQNKEYMQAQKIIEEAIQLGGNKSTIIIEHYGDILYQLGKKEKALDKWKEAEKMGKGSDKLGEKIQSQRLVE